ncbi:MAG: nitroreductase family protein [Desulfosudaceae bacterium]
MIDLLRKRRSIRSYQDRPIDAASREVLQEALLRSPSSRNIRPWEFVWIEDKETLGRLARAKPHGSSFLAGAALGIVVCGDPGQSDVWIEDCSIAAVIAHLAAASLGLGSCWVQIRRRHHDEQRPAEEYVRSVLDLPDTLAVEAIIAVGHPAEDKNGVPPADLPRQKIWSFPR